MATPESEAKFQVGQDFRLPKLGGVVGRFSDRLVATYWDTEDLRLLGWGHTLRFRSSSNAGGEWTLKLGDRSDGSSGDGSTLDRWEVTANGSPSSPPAELSAAIQGILRRERLGPVAVIETERDSLIVANDADRSDVVEVSDDRVTSTVGENPGPSFRQIEVEAKGENADRLLREVAGRLAEAGARRTAETKLGAVLGIDPLPEVLVPALRKSARVEDLVRHAVSTSVAQLLQADPKIRSSDDPEAVHAARVATRRLRSDLKSLEPVLAPVNALRDELAWLGELLGGVRDLDVLMAGMEALIGELSSRDEAAAGSIVAGLKKERRRCRRRLLEGLRSDRYLRLVGELVAASRQPRLARPSDRRRAKPVVREIVEKAWRRTDRAVRRLGPTPTDPELHEIRKRAKRARYAAELGAKLFGRPAERLATRLADVQDVLGELQDTVTAEERLRSLELSPDAAFLAGTLAAVERRRRAKARDRWRRRWKAARRHYRSRWAK